MIRNTLLIAELLGKIQLAIGLIDRNAAGGKIVCQDIRCGVGEAIQASTTLCAES